MKELFEQLAEIFDPARAEEMVSKLSPFVLTGDVLRKHEEAIDRLHKLSMPTRQIDSVELLDIVDDLIPSYAIVSEILKTDPVVLNSIKEVLNYSWEGEMKHFCEEHDGYEIQSQDNLYDWIVTCRRLGDTNHIFYHLMVVKDYFKIN